MPATNPTFTVKEVAQLIDGNGDLTELTVQKLSAFVREAPDFVDQVAILEDMAQQADIKPSAGARLEIALEAHEDFEQLLTATSWEHPAEVLDPDGEAGIAFRELLNIATFRSELLDKDPEVERVKAGLERAFAAQREETDLVEGFVDELLQLASDRADQLLRFAETQHRVRRLDLA